LLTTAYEIINTCADLLHEDFGDRAIWTRDELLKYVDQGQKEIAWRTISLGRVFSAMAVLDMSIYDLPDTGFVLDYLAYNDQEIFEAKIVDLDLADISWGNTTGTPSTFFKENISLDQFGVYPKPSAGGSETQWNGDRGVVRRIQLNPGTGKADQLFDSEYGSIRRVEFNNGWAYFSPGGEYAKRSGSFGAVATLIWSKSNLFGIAKVLPDTITNEGDTLMINSSHGFLVRDYVMWRALARDGDGQDQQRAAHFMERFYNMTKTLAGFISWE